MRHLTITDETVLSKIYLIRGKKVMLDRDLAEIYGVETKVLNQAVKRNINRFPDDFMFRLNPKELEVWMSQIVTSNKERMGLRKLPNAFTEMGVAMLSSVLKSNTAVEVNIQIVRIFNRMREVLIAHKDMFLKLEQLERKVLKEAERSERLEEEISAVFRALKQLINEPPPRRKIGFEVKSFN